MAITSDLDLSSIAQTLRTSLLTVRPKKAVGQSEGPIRGHCHKIYLKIYLKIVMRQNLRHPKIFLRHALKYIVSVL